jgi:hypothetical protein
MDSKLTLKLNQNVIEKAKQYAADQNLSLSRLVEFYFQSLTSSKKAENEGNGEIELSPFVKSMLTGNHLPADLDNKKEYGDHLEEKYK